MTNPQDPATPASPFQVTDPDDAFHPIREPRSEARLVIDGQWHQISKRYVTTQLLSDAIVAVLVVITGAVVAGVTGQWWPWAAAGALIVLTVLGAFVTARQARSIGYQLREDDIVFRRGILWQRMVAVPYGRMQLIDVTQGPLERIFGISQLKLVTAAATTGVAIPGLPFATAEQLRDLLVEVAESRRTGL